MRLLNDCEFGIEGILPIWLTFSAVTLLLLLPLYVPNDIHRL